MSIQRKEYKEYLCRWCKTNNQDNFYGKDKTLCKKCICDIKYIKKSVKNNTFDENSDAFLRMEKLGYTINDNKKFISLKKMETRIEYLLQRNIESSIKLNNMEKEFNGVKKELSKIKKLLVHFK
uniref:Uncharacterized protein n=1 Tax=viral metagenome TaxID=1070528 RepID=A0A6C0AFH1_9ZZZZ